MPPPPGIPEISVRSVSLGSSVNSGACHGRLPGEVGSSCGWGDSTIILFMCAQGLIVCRLPGHPCRDWEHGQIYEGNPIQIVRNWDCESRLRTAAANHSRPAPG